MKNHLRDKIIKRKEELKLSSYYVAKKCTDLCNETVYSYFRGTSDGSGKTISSIMKTLRLKVVPSEEEGADGRRKKDT